MTTGMELEKQSGKKILIIEDEADVRESIKLLLIDAGYIVRESADGLDISDIITEFNPDVVLLDLLLDDVDGREICKSIKQNPLTTNIPVIVISGLPDVYNAISESGANDIVAKPFLPSTLLNRIERQLQNSDISLAQ